MSCFGREDGGMALKGVVVVAGDDEDELLVGVFVGGTISDEDSFDFASFFILDVEECLLLALGSTKLFSMMTMLIQEESVSHVHKEDSLCSFLSSHFKLL